MTKHEQIQRHLSIIGRIASHRPMGPFAKATSIQKELDALKKLLKPKPEVVQRLIDLSNDLGRENALLRNDLTEMTLNFNAAEKHVASLKQDLETLRGLLALDEKYIEMLKHDRRNSS